MIEEEALTSMQQQHLDVIQHKHVYIQLPPPLMSTCREWRLKFLRCAKWAANRLVSFTEYVMHQEYDLKVLENWLKGCQIRKQNVGTKWQRCDE
jgi:hypothetical protein